MWDRDPASRADEKTEPTQSRAQPGFETQQLALLTGPAVTGPSFDDLDDVEWLVGVFEPVEAIHCAQPE